ncbi:MAG: hypothetical protein NPIRA01_29230 [Nitrospirales bacterium]|nr:MAG: hypothetical protein NPIRA01_29230 [Nitrospirales bacterium]
MITGSQKKPKRSPSKNPEAQSVLRTSRTKRGTQHVQRIIPRKTEQDQTHVNIHEQREHGTLKESLLVLEPRIMFDGAALVTGTEVTNDQLTQQETDATASPESKVQDTSSSKNPKDTLFESLTTLDTPSDRREIVFIDTAVDDYRALMAGIDVNAEVVLLDTTRDGIEQIAEILKGRGGFNAIHIVSHGDKAQLQLGTSTLTVDSMNAEYADELAIIGQAFTDNADLLIYGCNFGEGQAGQTAAARLAQLTGADIAASSNLTGNAALGGDWDLEVETGKIETVVAFSTQVQQVWSGILADGDTTVSFQEGVDGYASTQDTHLDESTPTTSYGNQTTVEVDLSNSSDGEEHALIRFDNLFGSGTGQIPLGATIISVTLALDGTDPSSSAATISLHRMLTTWNESSTWNSMTSGISTNDVEASSTADATIYNPETIESKVLTGLESTVQAWSDGDTNYGWVIKSDHGDGWVFSSSENGTASLRPKLTVEYRTSGGDTSTGLTGHWTFDANANDSSGNSYNGTLTNGASVDTTDLTDKVGAGKLSLDGSNDYVDLSSHVGNFSSLTEGTISAWVKTTDSGTNTIFDISDTNDTDSYINLAIQAGNLEFDIEENGTDQLDVNTNNISVNDGSWHHVAVTVSTSGNALYVDGAKITDLTYEQGSSSTQNFFNDVSGLDAMGIGRNENSGGGRWNFNGLIDDVRVYNTALSVTDMAALAAEAPVAYNDTATTTKNTAVNIDLTTNDTDLDSETISVLDVGNPTNGTVVNNDDGTVTYTPTGGYTGTDSFTYLAADLDDTTSYWRLDGNGTDAVGSNDGTLTGTTTVTGVYGDALSFDEVDDKVVVSDFAINNEFSLSFKFKVDDNSGSDYQYFYSHGSTASSNSLNIFIGESGSAEANLLRTRLLDTDDSGDSSALEFDVGNIIGDGQWHTYTLTVASGGGSKVYLDGILKNSDSRGGDSFNPTTDVYFGIREDLDSNRFYGGSLDSVQLFNRALSAEEVNDAHTGGSSLATVNVLVNDPPVNSVPGAQVVNEDTALVFNSANSNLISIADGDAGSNPLRVTLTATNGTMTLSQITGLTFTTGDGTADATMVFEGTLTNINAALDGLSFLGDQDFNGAANIQITTDDLTLTGLNEDTDLVGYYTFNATGDLGNDDSTGGANDGTVNGAVTNSDATRGNVLSFDGVDDYVQITGLMSSPADVTLAAWVNLDAVAIEGAEVLSIGDYVAIRADDITDAIKGFFYDGASWHEIQTNTFIAGTGWHHVAYTFDDTNNIQTLYIDGVSVATDSRTESISYSGLGTNTFLGHHGNGSGDFYLDGKLDDARIYDRALTSTEIANLAFEPISTDTDNIAITVNATNDTSSVTNLSGDTLNYTEGDGAVIIEQGDDVVVTDVDSTDFDTGSLTVAFTAGSDSDEDELAIRNQGTGAGQIGVSGSNVTYEGTTIGTFTGGTSGANLVITFNSNADPTATTALIKNITYENTDTDAPTTGARTVRFTLNDGDGGATIRNTTVNVSGQNDAPVLTPATPTFTTINEDDTSNSGDLVSALLGSSVTDVDSGAVEGMAITNLASGNGTWQYNTGSGWTDIGTVSNTSALLLRSTDSIRFVPDTQNATTASVTYRAWDQTAGTAGTKVTTASNGGATAFSTATDTASITVSAVIDAPVITNLGGDTLAYTEGDGASVIDQSTNAAVTDVDSSEFDTGTLTVSFTAGSDSAEDVLAIQNVGTGAGQISVAGSAVSYEGTQIGTFTGGTSGANLVITLNANADATAVGALVQTITYENTDTDAPTTGSRTVRYVLTDGDGGTSPNYDTTVTVSGDNDVPIAVDDPGDFNSTVTTLNPLGYWRLGEGAGGSAADDGSLGNNGTYNGVTLGQPGALTGDANTAVDFNGFSDYIEVAHDPGYLLDQGSIQLWFKADTIGFVETLFSKDSEDFDTGGHLGINMLATGEIEVRLQDTVSNHLVTSTTKVTAGTWHHVVFTFGASGMNLYLDGSVEDNNVYAGGLGNTSGDVGNFEPIVIGASTRDSGDTVATPLSRYFGGLIDEVAIFGTQLNASSIQNLYATGVQAYPVLEDGVLSVSASEGVLNNDTDADGDGLTASLVAGPSNASAFTLNADGSFTYTPVANFTGTDTFTYQVSDGNGGTDTATATISVTADNDAPVLTPATPTLTPITEDATGNSGELISAIVGASITDVDSGAVEGIAITSLNSSNGTWQYDTGGGWTAVGAVTNASALLLRATDSLRFVPDAQNSDTASVTYRAWDQTAGAAGTNVDVSTNGGTTAFSTATDTASLTVTAVNDAPVLDNTGTMTLTTIAEDDTNSAGDTVAAIISSAGVDRLNDVDTGAVEGLAVIGVDNTNGTWQYDAGAGWTAFGAVTNTNAVLLDTTASIRFVPDASYTGTAGDITFRAWDTTTGSDGDTGVDVSTNGGTTAFSTATETATLTVTAVNDAPVLTPATPTLTPITEDATGNSGELISAIVGASITDVDSGAVEGVAITSLNSSNGTWQYDTGGGWTAVGAVTNTSALLLRATDSLRFVPDAQNSDTASVTYRAWDQTAGAAGTNVDVSTNGGTTAFSTATDTASLTVTAVNDAPTITSDGGGAMANLNVVEGNTTVTTVTTTDIDLPADTLTYSLVGGVDQGLFSIHPNNGTLTFDITPSFANPADSNLDNSYEVHVQVSDGKGGTDIQAIIISVNDTNTAPIITSHGGGATASIDIAEEATSAVTTVQATDVDLPGDTLTYSLVGGADADRFSINSITGALTFRTIPDFENSLDADNDNVYLVQVQVSDGKGGTDMQSLRVSVTNIIEALPPVPESPPSPEPPTEPDFDPVTEETDDSITQQPPLTSLETQAPVPAMHLTEVTSDRSIDKSEDPGEFEPVLYTQLDDLPTTYLSDLASVNLLTFEEISLNQRRADVRESSLAAMAINLDQQLDELAQHLQETIQHDRTREQIVSGLTTGTGVTISAGYIAWVLRGTSLLTSLFASLPAWGHFDPLPVLTGGYTARQAEQKSNQTEADQENQEHQGIDKIFRDSE